MQNVPVKELLALIETWKEQEKEYNTEGLVSESNAVMMTRVDLESLLKKHNINVPKTISYDVGQAEYLSLSKSVV